MKKPKYIAVIGKDNKRLSHMWLEGEYYETHGWSLPVSNIKWHDGYGEIVDFMEHLDGNLIEPISKSVYTKGKWGVKSKIVKSTT